jgi:hypothetical protein
MYKSSMPGHLGNKPLYSGTQQIGPLYATYLMSLFWHLQLSSGSYIILKFVDTPNLLKWLATEDHFIHKQTE